MREKDLFKWLQENVAEDLEFMKDEFSKWDCISPSKMYVMELKCRRTHYPTLLIEKKKYDAIVAKAKQLMYTPLYINSTPEGIYSWNLDKVDIKWKVENKHPATTAFGNRQRVAKEVGYLSIDDGQMLKEF